MDQRIIPWKMVMMYDNTMSQLLKMPLFTMGSSANRYSHNAKPTIPRGPRMSGTSTAADFHSYIVPPAVSPNKKTAELMVKVRLPTRSNRRSLSRKSPGISDWWRKK